MSMSVYSCACKCSCTYIHMDVEAKVNYLSALVSHVCEMMFVVYIVVIVGVYKCVHMHISAYECV